MMPTIVDIHCPHCNQFIVESNHMKPLSVFEQGKTTPHANQLMIAHVGAMVIINADFMCPTCGRMVYFRLNEQKLNMVISQIAK